MLPRGCYMLKKGHIKNIDNLVSLQFSIYRGGISVFHALENSLSAEKV